MNINEVKQNVSENIFYDYNSEDVWERNAVEYHAMTGEHTEILGQFLDVTGMDVEDLKECLINGYLNRIMNKKRDRAKSVIRFDNYNHEWWAGRCPNCNRIIGFDYGCDSNPGNRKCYCSKCGQLCDFEDMD